MALRCPQCDHEYYTPYTRVVPDWLRDHARRNIVGHAQAESVCQTITEARAELLQYDSHIARLRATLTQLENERAGLQDFVSHHETLLPPIRRVPTEVLTLIFAECCEDDDVLYTNRHDAPSEIPPKPSPAGEHNERAGVPCDDASYPAVVPG